MAIQSFSSSGPSIDDRVIHDTQDPGLPYGKVVWSEPGHVVYEYDKKFWTAKLKFLHHLSNSLSEWNTWKATESKEVNKPADLSPRWMVHLKWKNGRTYVYQVWAPTTQSALSHAITIFIREMAEDLKFTKTSKTEVVQWFPRHVKFQKL